MDPRRRAQEEIARQPEPLVPPDEQVEDPVPEDGRIDDDEDDTLGRPVELDR